MRIRDQFGDLAIILRTKRSNEQRKKLMQEKLASIGKIQANAIKAEERMYNVLKSYGWTTVKVRMAGAELFKNRVIYMFKPEIELGDLVGIEIESTSDLYGQFMDVVDSMDDSKYVKFEYLQS